MVELPLELDFLTPEKSTSPVFLNGQHHGKRRREQGEAKRGTVYSKRDSWEYQVWGTVQEYTLNTGTTTFIATMWPGYRVAVMLDVSVTSPLGCLLLPDHP